LKTLSDFAEVIPASREVFEQFLAQIADYKQEFVDEKVLVLTSIIKRSQSVTPYETEFVRSIPEIWARQNKLGTMYLFLTNFIDVGISTIS
jgi:hypothetical protein